MAQNLKRGEIEKSKANSLKLAYISKIVYSLENKIEFTPSDED